MGAIQSVKTTRPSSVPQMTLDSEELADMAALALLIIAAAVVVEEDGGSKVGKIRVMPVSLPFAGQHTGA